MRKTYFVLTNRYCTQDPTTFKWSCELPLDFVNSHSEKLITVTNFYTDDHYHTEDGNASSVYNSPHISFHCPTLTDGNFHQGYYICSCTEDVVPKTYPINSHPQKMEFWFEELCSGSLINLAVPFIVELELIY